MKYLSLIVLVLVVLVMVTGHWRAEQKQKQPAPAVPAKSQWTEPYGGCKEAADYPGSPGYKDCVEHGWNPPAR